MYLNRDPNLLHIAKVKHLNKEVEKKVIRCRLHDLT